MVFQTIHLIVGFGVLSHIAISSNVPYISVEGGNQNEREILVSPFTNITEDKLRGRFSNGEIEYNGTKLKEEFVKVEGRPLTQLSQEEQKRLYDEVMQQIEEIDGKIVEYYELLREENDVFQKRQSFDEQLKSLRNNYSIVNRSADNIRENKENKLYLEDEIKKLEIQFYSLTERKKAIKQEILQWRAKIGSLIEARCADKEHEIEGRIDNVLAEKEVENRRKAEIASQGQSRATDIRNTVFSSVSSAMQTDAYKKMADFQNVLEHVGSKNGIKFNSPIRDLTRAIEGLKTSGNYRTISAKGYEEFDVKRRGGYSIKDQLTMLGDVITKNAPSIISVTENEFKKSVMQEVLKIRVAQEESILRARRQAVEKQDTGFFGRKRKDEEKARALKIIDQQISKMSDFQGQIDMGGIGSSYTYSVRQIMAEIMHGIDCSRDESQSMRLKQLKQSLEEMFNYSRDGVSKIYNSEKEVMREDTRSEMFLSKYDKLYRLEAKEPNTSPKITEYVLNMNRIISQLGSIRDQSRDQDRDQSRD